MYHLSNILLEFSLKSLYLGWTYVFSEYWLRKLPLLVFKNWSTIYISCLKSTSVMKSPSCVVVCSECNRQGKRRRKREGGRERNEMREREEVREGGRGRKGVREKRRKKERGSKYIPVKVRALLKVSGFQPSFCGKNDNLGSAKTLFLKQWLT